MIAFELLSYYNRYAYNNYCKKIDEAMAKRFSMIADDALPIILIAVSAQECIVSSRHVRPTIPLCWEM